MKTDWVISSASSAPAPIFTATLYTTFSYLSTIAANASVSPTRQRLTRPMSSSTDINTIEKSKSWWDHRSRYGVTAFSRLVLNLENLVKSGVPEDIPDMLVHIHQFELLPRPSEPLLDHEQNTQASAGDIFQLAEVKCGRGGDRAQGFFCGGHLGCIEPANQLHDVLVGLYDRKHEVTL